MVPCTYSGVTEYPDVGKVVTWTTPIISGKFKMQNGDGILIRNNSLSAGIGDLLLRYSILLANIDMSLSCVLINEREQNLLSAPNQNIADSINNMYKNLEEYGKRRAVVNNSLYESIHNGLISLPATGTKDSIKSILACYDTILQMFYNDIGIRYNKDKKERMVESEVVSDSQRLLINIMDMYECRKKACEEINNKFNLNVSVKLSNEIVLSENNKNIEG